MPAAETMPACLCRLTDLPLLTGEVRYERGFFDSLVQRVLAFIAALMVFLQTLYSPNAAKQYQERSRRNARQSSGGSGSRLGGQSRIRGMSNLGGSSSNGTCVVDFLYKLHGSMRIAVSQRLQDAPAGPPCAGGS